MVDLHNSLRPTGTVPPLPVSEIAARGKQRKRRRLISTAGLAVAMVGAAAFAISNMPGSTAETVTVADGSEGEASDETTIPSQTATADETAIPDETTIPDRPTISDQTTLAPNTSSTTSAAQTTSSITATDTAPEESALEGGGADGDAPVEPHLMTTPGLRTTETTTSEWEDGYCVQIEVINDSVDRDSWQVGLDLDGTITTFWNATFVEAGSGTFVFSGAEGYNVAIQSGEVTNFGTCVNTGS